jgi:recombination protein RecT
MTSQQADFIVNNPFIDSLSAQLKQKPEYGLSFPADYNPTNALMGAYLILKETKDKNGKYVLETCSQASIANALMDMVTMGLSMQKRQCYPIAYGGKLQCQVSYHGHKTMAHRYGVRDINAEVIYEGDTFKYHLKNGRKILDEHIQNFENIDLTKIKGAYCVIIFSNNDVYMEVMNIHQIKTAWKRGYGYKENSGTHAEFTDMMVKKTVTSRACKQIVQQYGDAFIMEASDKAEKIDTVDVISEDVNHDIQIYANTEDFPMLGEQEETVREAEITPDQPEETDQTPDWTKVPQPQEPDWA